VFPSASSYPTSSYDWMPHNASFGFLDMPAVVAAMVACIICILAVVASLVACIFCMLTYCELCHLRKYV
jgi:hypothetical protein